MAAALVIWDHTFHILAIICHQYSSTLMSLTPTWPQNVKLGAYLVYSMPHHCPTSVGLVLKHDGSWQTIYHLSAPHGSSINDFIESETYTFLYCSLENSFAIDNSLGRGMLIAKIDLKNAFCLISVRSRDWNLLGICWRNKFYVDTCLPFGLRSTPSFLIN